MTSSPTPIGDDFADLAPATQSVPPASSPAALPPRPPRKTPAE